MNQRAAFEETLYFARVRLGMDDWPGDIRELNYAHLADMYQRILDADARGEPFSDAKIGRWLGWAQACVVMGGANLEQMKAINQRHK